MSVANPGIGRVTDNILSELNFKTVGDIRRHRDRIFVAFTPKQSKFLIRASLGVDSTEGASEEGDSSPLKSSKNKKNESLHSVSELQKSIGEFFFMISISLARSGIIIAAYF